MVRPKCVTSEWWGIFVSLCVIEEEILEWRHVFDHTNSKATQEVYMRRDSVGFDFSDSRILIHSRDCI